MIVRAGVFWAGLLLLQSCRWWAPPAEGAPVPDISFRELHARQFVHGRSSASVRAGAAQYYRDAARLEAQTVDARLHTSDDGASASEAHRLVAPEAVWTLRDGKATLRGGVTWESAEVGTGHTDSMLIDSAAGNASGTDPITWQSDGVKTSAGAFRWSWRTGGQLELTGRVRISSEGEQP